MSNNSEPTDIQELFLLLFLYIYTAQYFKTFKTWCQIMERDTNQAILRKLSKHKFKDNIGPSLIDIYAWETGDT